MTVSTGPGSSLVAAAEWIQSAFLGTVATSLAVLAVSAVGMLMLNGRVNIRRGATVLMGCFILFGAATIARGIMGAASGSATDAGAPQIQPNPIIPPAAPLSVPPPPPPPEDPYAGAAFRG